MKNIIKVDEVEKHFGNQVIIPSLSLNIKEGEFITILGPSGCGKTTLLRMIAGFEEPTSGNILLDGTVINNLPPYKRDMNLVFQNYALFPHMNVEENISFGLKMKGMSKSEQAKRAEEVMALTQLTEFKKRKPKQLSGGQQQRVAIARAIINNPKVLLLDEPLAALDAKLRKDLQRELKNLQRNLGITFVFVTHDQEEAMAMSDRIAVMNNGKIEQLGTPEDIYYQPKSLFVASFIGENNILTENGKTVAVRPECVKISPLEQENVVGFSEKICVVKDLEFLGNHHKVYLYVEGTSENLVAYQTADRARPYQIGEKVRLSWSSADEVIVE